MPCYRCGRIQTDPARGASPWARGVVGDEQVLVCPECQTAEPSWPDDLARCPSCGSTRLGIVMGSVVCRACGHDRPLD
ncbi:MAG TPA: hypothetical protein VM638_05890 [Actinomycetota bacterium]|jgi:uncharacterized protein (DUF983 family)|nr:hypothetical protein [Actinomycetota bacterium]